MDQVDQAGVALRIRQIMRGNGLNQTGLAGALGITQPAVSKYLNDRMPPVEIFYRLARLGGVTMEWLLTGTADAGKPRVAEPHLRYQTGTSAMDRISRLPRNVQAALEVLVTELEGSI